MWIPAPAAAPPPAPAAQKIVIDGRGPLALVEVTRTVVPEPAEGGGGTEALLDLALALQLAGDLGGEVSVCEQAVELDDESVDAWTRLAHALARTDRISECLAACERAIELGAGGEVSDLLEWMRRQAARELGAAEAHADAA